MQKSLVARPRISSALRKDAPGRLQRWWRKLHELFLYYIWPEGVFDLLIESMKFLGVMLLVLGFVTHFFVWPWPAAPKLRAISVQVPPSPPASARMMDFFHGRTGRPPAHEYHGMSWGAIPGSQAHSSDAIHAMLSYYAPVLQEMQELLQMSSCPPRTTTLKKKVGEDYKVDKVFLWTTGGQWRQIPNTFRGFYWSRGLGLLIWRAVLHAERDREGGLRQLIALHQRLVDTEQRCKLDGDMIRRLWISLERVESAWILLLQRGPVSPELRDTLYSYMQKAERRPSPLAALFRFALQERLSFHLQDYLEYFEPWELWERKRSRPRVQQRRWLTQYVRRMISYSHQPFELPKNLPEDQYIDKLMSDFCCSEKRSLWSVLLGFSNRTTLANWLKWERIGFRWLWRAWQDRCCRLAYRRAEWMHYLAWKGWPLPAGVASPVALDPSTKAPFVDFSKKHCSSFWGSEALKPRLLAELYPLPGEMYTRREANKTHRSFFFEGGKRARATLRKGQLDGPIMRWHRNGRKRMIGFYRKGRRHGRFLWWDKKGNRLRLKRFVDGNAHGEELRWAPGGQKLELLTYADGRLHGPWRRWRVDGKLHREGAFVRGRSHGTFRAWYPNGRKQWEVSYVHGVRQQDEQSWHPNGRRWRKSLPDGRVRVWSPDGTLREGAHTHKLPRGGKELVTYRKGLRDGRFVRWYPNGRKAEEGHYAAGRKHGRFVSWSPQGHKEAQTDFRQGRRHGLHKRWHANKALAEQRSFRDGRLDGRATTWDAKGREVGVAHYKDGVLDGLSRRWQQGVLRWQAFFRRGARHGVVTRWDPKGVKRSQIPYQRGKKQGLARWWTAKGHRARQRSFRSGLLIGEIAWFADGRVRTRCTLQGGRRTLQCRGWGPDGRLRRQWSQFLSQGLCGYEKRWEKDKAQPTIRAHVPCSQS